MLTPDMLKVQAMIEKPETMRLINTYVNALAYAQVTREQVDKVWTAVLQEIAIYNDLDIELNVTHEKQRIYDEKHSYLSKDDEATQRIYDELDKRCKLAGIKPADMQRDYCPALVAEHEVSKLQRIIADTVGAAMNINADKMLCSTNGLETYKKFIDLVVGAAIRSPKWHKYQRNFAA